MCEHFEEVGGALAQTGAADSYHCATFTLTLRPILAALFSTPMICILGYRRLPVKGNPAFSVTCLSHALLPHPSGPTWRAPGEGLWPGPPSGLVGEYAETHGGLTLCRAWAVSPRIGGLNPPQRSLPCHHAHLCWVCSVSGEDGG